MKIRMKVCIFCDCEFVQIYRKCLLIWIYTLQCITCIQICIIMWKYKHVLVQYSNGLKEIGCQILLYLNTIWITDSSTIWIPDKLTLSFFLMYWSNIQMVGLVHVHSTIWIPNHLKSEFLKVWYSNGRYSDPHCIWILSKWIFQCLF